MSAETEPELTPALDEAASGEMAPPPDPQERVLAWPDAGTAARPNPVHRLTRLATERRSPWPGRMIAGAVGAGLTLVVLALRDSLVGRRASVPEPPSTARRRLAAWLRGENR